MLKILLFFAPFAFPIAISCTQIAARGPETFAASIAEIPPIQKKPLIVLDPGHGGNDIGAQTKVLKEKVLALQTATLIKQYLNQKGYRVILTRSRDIFLSLNKRITIANDTKSKIFISIHFNAFKNPEVNGIEIYYYNKGDKERQNASKKLAQIVLDGMTVSTGAKSRGVKNGNFHVIRETHMPAILIEGGFITNPMEHSNLANTQYVEKMARSVAEALDKYLSH